MSKKHRAKEPEMVGTSIDIHCEDCDALDHATATMDEASTHELKTGHEVVVHVY